MEPDRSSADDSRLEAREAYREVKFRHSRDFVKLLDELGASLLISTYLAGKLGVVGAP